MLSALKSQRPEIDLLYVADSGHAPYGERADAHVIERSLRIAGYLVDQGARLLVVACNTATAVAAAALRERWPLIPLVGVEPAIKPAVAVSRNGRIGVMATAVTLHSEKFSRLLQRHAGHAVVTLQPCPGLAGLIEQGDLAAPQLLTLIAAQCQPLKDADVDTVVLGCTHYPFVRHHIQALLGPHVRLVDSAQAVARQVLKLMDDMPCLATPDAGDLQVRSLSGAVRLQSTGDLAALATASRHWLDFECVVSTAPGL